MTALHSPDATGAAEHVDEVVDLVLLERPGSWPWRRRPRTPRSISRRISSRVIWTVLPSPMRVTMELTAHPSTVALGRGQDATHLGGEDRCPRGLSSGRTVVAGARSRRPSGRGGPPASATALRRFSSSWTMELRSRNSSVASGRLARSPGLSPACTERPSGMAAMSSASPMSISLSVRARRREAEPREILVIPPLVEREQAPAQLRVAERVRQDVEEAAERVRVHDHAADADHGRVQPLLLRHALDVGRDAQALVVDEGVGDRDDEPGLVAEVVADGRLVDAGGGGDVLERDRLVAPSRPATPGRRLQDLLRRGRQALDGVLEREVQSALWASGTRSRSPLTVGAQARRAAHSAYPPGWRNPVEYPGRLHTAQTRALRRRPAPG